MDLTRTTIRLNPALKKEIHSRALEENTTFQEFVERSLRETLKKKAVKRAKKLVFYSHDLGVPLDNLTRDDFYDD